MLRKWRNKTLFLRKVVIRHHIGKENVNPIISTRKKKFTHGYFLDDENGQKQEVCRAFILNLLQVNKSKLFRVARSANTNPGAIDKRGNVNLRKIHYYDTQFIRDFITRFTQYESKFDVLHATSKFLHPRLNLRHLYQYYRVQCSFQERKILSLTYFTKIFKQEFKLIFFKTKKPFCQMCKKTRLHLNRLVISDQAKAAVLESQEQHLHIMTQTIQRYRKTVETAQHILSKIEVLTFGLGMPFDLPYIKSSDDLQKHKLWLHQFCVFDEVRRKYTVYVWPENIASKGAQEIGSCLIRYLMEEMPEDTEQLILYSDPCFGQNRNITLLLVIQKCLQSWPHTNLKSIQQRFFMPGHSYNSTDEYFKLIQKKKKLCDEILIPTDAIEMIKNVKKKCE